LQHNIKQIKKTLQDKNLVIARTDKSKTIVIIDKLNLEQKIEQFIADNKIEEVRKDPTTSYQKQIQQVIKGCADIIVKEYTNTHLI